MFPRDDDDMSNPMWAHILRLLDDEEQATMVFQIFKQAMITRAIETDLSVKDRAQHVANTSALVAAELAGLDSLKGSTDLQRRQQLLLATRVVGKILANRSQSAYTPRDQRLLLSMPLVRMCNVAAHHLFDSAAPALFSKTAQQRCQFLLPYGL